MESHVRLVAHLTLQPGGVGVGLVYVSGLHRHEYLLGRTADRQLDLGDEIHKFDRMRASDVINPVRHAVGAVRTGRDMVEGADRAFDDIVYESEVADHVASVEHFDGLALGDGRRKEHRGHVRAAPRAVDSKEPQTGARDAVKLGIGVRHELVGLLGGCIEADRAVNLVVLRVRDLGVEPVHGARRGEHQMLYGVESAGLEDIEESHEIALEICVRVGDGIPDARLGGKVDDRVESLGVKQRIKLLFVGDVHLYEALALPRAELLYAALLEPDVIVVVEIVDAYGLVSPGREDVHQFRAYEAGGSSHKYLHRFTS